MSIKQLVISILISSIVSTGLSFFLVKNYLEKQSKQVDNQKIESSASVLGGQPPSKKLIDSLCVEDVKKYCFNEISENRQDACLQDNIDLISASCRDKISNVRKSFASCEREIEKFCKSAGYGGGRMIRCLSDYYEELSNECKARVGKIN